MSLQLFDQNTTPPVCQHWNLPLTSLLSALICSGIARATPLSATPHSSDDNIRSDSRKTKITPHREYINKSPDSSLEKASSRRHNSLFHQVKKTTTATSQIGSIAATTRANPQKMCITYISLYTGCGCPSDSLFEPCDKALHGTCGSPAQEVVLKSSYDDDDEHDDDSADDVRICDKCLKELKESVRRLFESFRSDGVKVASRAGDQVYLVGDNAWSMDCD